MEIEYIYPDPDDNKDIEAQSANQKDAKRKHLRLFDNGLGALGRFVHFLDVTADTVDDTGLFDYIFSRIHRI